MIVKWTLTWPLFLWPTRFLLKSENYENTRNFRLASAESPIAAQFFITFVPLKKIFCSDNHHSHEAFKRGAKRQTFFKLHLSGIKKVKLFISRKTFFSWWSCKIKKDTQRRKKGFFSKRQGQGDKFWYLTNLNCVSC